MKPVSLSTMWGVNKFPRIDDFVAKARRMAFSHVEVNYQVPAEALDVFRTDGCLPVSSVHAPCPDAHNDQGLAAYRVPLTTLDRDQASFILRLALATVDLAAELKARFVVVHVGSVTPVVELERQFRNLFKEGKADSEEFRVLKEKLVETRAVSKGPYIERAREVLRRLHDHAGERGVRIGLETRFYYHEIPNLEEMQQFLDEFDDGVLAFWHDTGHAENLSRLGFTPHREWLERLGHKIAGVHLHDVQGILDHWAPGTGDLDWLLVARRLPADAVRVCELAGRNEEAAVAASIGVLREHGIV